MARKNELWLGTIDEIINAEKLCDYPMEKGLVSFFRENKEFMYLTNERGDIYETPTIVYATCPINRIDFYVTFGVPYSHDEVFGSGYYFTTYQDIVTKNKKEVNNELKQSIGILRIALFLKNMTIYSHLEEKDKNDWKLNHDTLYINDTRSILYVAKEYEQQYVLSSQWISFDFDGEGDEIQE
jgi:hypothetical protein